MVIISESDKNNTNQLSKVNFYDDIDIIQKYINQRMVYKKDKKFLLYNKESIVLQKTDDGKLDYTSSSFHIEIPYFNIIQFLNTIHIKEIINFLTNEKCIFILKNLTVLSLFGYYCFSFML